MDTNYEWEAADQMPSPDTRQIWTSLDVLNNDLKNFNDANSDKINLNLFTLTEMQCQIIITTVAILMEVVDVVFQVLTDQ